MVEETYFFQFRRREFSVDGNIIPMPVGMGRCRECGNDDECISVNTVVIKEVRDGNTQVVLSSYSDVVMELRRELRDRLKVGKHLCFNCLPGSSKDMAL